MHHTFPAVRGIQAGREYYITMCPLRLVPKLFLFEDDELDPALRAQRIINKSRIPLIAKYISENPNDYVLSSITASVDCLVEFSPISEAPSHHNIGTIQIPMTAKFLVNDGQHRRAAIEQAIKTNPTLKEETLSIVLFIDEGLRRSQQMFADLNRYAIRPTQSLNILYDHRDPLAKLVRRLVQEVDVFDGLTEMDKSSISNRSKNLFTLSGIYNATEELLAYCSEQTQDEQTMDALEFWKQVSDYVPGWLDVKMERQSAADLRKEYMNAHSITLVAIGRAGSVLLRDKTDWKDQLRKLKEIDWRRSNRLLWEGRATVGGKISFSRNNLLLMTNAVKQALNLSLTDEEQAAEEAFQSAKTRRGNL
ncbi:DNA sulfur modification protein DndB [Brevibacillus dissolubilis]|uniref:DNA sulfur modification protein DndB n=1 Tax=Brevibacillus dissolubilis TaxID=1844116 RepID=UPI001C3F1AF3|nr:DNA sulfur modification protein DndB [Brevibacillus dissolubilis]